MNYQTVDWTNAPAHVGVDLAVILPDETIDWLIADEDKDICHYVTAAVDIIQPTAILDLVLYGEQPTGSTIQINGSLPKDTAIAIDQISGLTDANWGRIIAHYLVNVVNNY